MPRRKNLIATQTVFADASVDDLCQQYWSHQVNADSAAAKPEKLRHKGLRDQVRTELERRLGDATDNVLESHAAGHAYEDARQPAFNADGPPQRVRRPRMMYVEQKTDGPRSLADRVPAAVGEVSFSKSGRTAYFNGKAFHRVKGICGNYQCVEDGDEYWISGVKTRGTNRHWAGGGPIANIAKAKREKG